MRGDEDTCVCARTCECVHVCVHVLGDEGACVWRGRVCVCREGVCASVVLVFCSENEYVPRNLGICAISRLRSAFSESRNCVPISRLRKQS